MSFSSLVLTFSSLSSRPSALFRDDLRLLFPPPPLHPLRFSAECGVLVVDLQLPSKSSLLFFAPLPRSTSRPQETRTTSSRRASRKSEVVVAQLRSSPLPLSQLDLLRQELVRATTRTTEAEEAVLGCWRRRWSAEGSWSRCTRYRLDARRSPSLS